MKQEPDIESRRETLRKELWEVGHSITDPTFDGETARNQRIAEIQAELDALPAPPRRRIGMEAGIVAIHSVLGDRLVRAPERDDTDPDFDHPHIREYGGRIK